MGTSSLRVRKFSSKRELPKHLQICSKTFHLKRVPFPLDRLLNYLPVESTDLNSSSSDFNLRFEQISQLPGFFQTLFQTPFRLPPATMALSCRLHVTLEDMSDFDDQLFQPRCAFVCLLQILFSELCGLRFSRVLVPPAGNLRNLFISLPRLEVF